MLQDRAKMNIPNIQICIRFETIIVIRNIEITLKMADTSNEEPLSVSTTATTSGTGLDMY